MHNARYIHRDRIKHILIPILPPARGLTHFDMGKSIANHSNHPRGKRVQTPPVTLYCSGVVRLRVNTQTVWSI